MGCDIHLFVEKRVNGRWVTADKWKTDKDDEPPRKRVPYDAAFYHDRNYELFSILADVRNGRGFAGIKTGEGFVPIADPRGLPDDVCDEVRAEAESWGGDGHSHSHLTVAELMAYDWTQTSKLCGWVDGVEFERWSRYDRGQGSGPESYCGDVSGPAIKKITEPEMRRACVAALEEAEKVKHPDREKFLREKLCNLYVAAEWELPYYKCCTRFLGQTLPRLWRLGANGDVRIVFWFDN